MDTRQSILNLVVADAKSRLSRSMKRQDHYEAMSALRELVGAYIPDRHMPTSQIDTVYRRTPGPHVAWKWVSRNGTLILLAEVPHDPVWDKVVVSAQVLYPGLSRRPRKIYHEETSDLDAVPTLVAQAVRQFEAQGL